MLLWRVLIDLVSDFLSVLDATDRLAAYRSYFETNRPLLSAYWRNYVLDPDTPPAKQVVEQALAADRSDLRALVESVDLVRMAEDTLARASDVLRIDRPTDVCLMVGVGGANAGELVIRGRGVAFICVEHFTGKANPETFGLGLSPELIPLWIAHELAHAVRYTSPESQSPMRQLIREAGGYYDYWQTGSWATLRELMINEGLAVHASQIVAPGFDPADYFGYARRQYHRLRELEAFLRRATDVDLDRRALGLRLRFLAGGMSPAARLVRGRVIPERAGYYLGHRMAEALVAERGIAAALRAKTEDFQQAEGHARGFQTA